MNKHGYTLVEVMIAVAIIGIFAALLVAGIGRCTHVAPSGTQLPADR